MRIHRGLIIGGLLFSTSSFADTARFKGQCQKQGGNGEGKEFDFEVIQRTIHNIEFAEVDGFGTEIKTKVNISFPISSVYALSLSTDMPPPFNSETAISGFNNGTNVRVTFPLRLGGAVKCSGVTIIQN
jgi:hypothetical protein